MNNRSSPRHGTKMALTGEIYYRSARDEFSLSPNFQQFLHHDSDPIASHQEMTAQLNSLRKARIHARNLTKAKINTAEKLLKTLEIKRQQILTSLAFENEQKKDNFIQLSENYDKKMMEIALEYAGLLHYEVEMSRVNVRAEQALVESLQRQAIAAYQMKLFSEYVSLESKGLIRITTLAKDSEQYKRCKKAIKDNITASFLRNGSYQGVRVLNVYHLNNQRLSRQLQNAVQSAPNGKVRGMFCAIPRQSIYSMCVYGLHPRESSIRSSTSSFASGVNIQQSVSSPHKVGSSPCSPIQRKKLKGKTPPYDSILGRNIFEWSWYCFPPNDQTERAGAGGITFRNPTEVTPLIKGIGSAMKLVSTSSSSVSSLNSLTTTPHSYLRFTRSSTPVSLLLPEMTSDDSNLSEEGCYLGLCRVLMNSIHTIPLDRGGGGGGGGGTGGGGGGGELNSSEIMEAMRKGCDTVYSEKSEEYVLIQPQCCLPEFIIHLQFVKNFESSVAADSYHLYSTLAERSHQLSHSSALPINDNNNQQQQQQQHKTSETLTPQQRKHQWLNQVDQFFLPNHTVESGTTELDKEPEKVDNEVIARRKRNLIRAVIDETRNTTSQLLPEKINSSYLI